jgi:hypothetical protein
MNIPGHGSSCGCVPVNCPVPRPVVIIPSTDDAIHDIVEKMPPFWWTPEISGLYGAYDFMGTTDPFAYLCTPQLALHLLLRATHVKTNYNRPGGLDDSASIHLRSSFRALVRLAGVNRRWRYLVFTLLSLALKTVYGSMPSLVGIEGRPPTFWTFDLKDTWFITGYEACCSFLINAVMRKTLPPMLSDPCATAFLFHGESLRSYLLDRTLPPPPHKHHLHNLHRVHTNYLPYRAPVWTRPAAPKERRSTRIAQNTIKDLVAKRKRALAFSDEEDESIKEQKKKDPQMTPSRLSKKPHKL